MMVGVWFDGGWIWSLTRVFLKEDLFGYRGWGCVSDSCAFFFLASSFHPATIPLFSSIR